MMKVFYLHLTSFEFSPCACIFTLSYFFCVNLNKNIIKLSRSSFCCAAYPKTSNWSDNKSVLPVEVSSSIPSGEARCVQNEKVMTSFSPGCDKHHNSCG